APQWLTKESLRKEWAKTNNARLHEWSPSDAPLWMSGRWKREAWATNKNELEREELTYHIPCECDKCGKRLIGIESSGIIYDLEMNDMIGKVRRKVYFETDCVLCVECYDALRVALQAFEAAWVGKGERQ
ncbi:MAG: hypothetical protein DRI69_09830, partial [Bacteroidetes bacterium]